MRRPALAALTVCLPLVGLISCAHPGLEPAAAPEVSPAGSLPAAGRQTLLRVRYRGLDGRGRVRLTVRVYGEDYQLAAADAFGRQLWTLAGGSGQTLLLDHRQREACPLAAEVAIPAIALSDLPVSMLPGVLLGALPFPHADQRGLAELDRTDATGRRWTATVAEDGRPLSWTLWGEGRPLVWWQSTDKGAILSHRDGAQVLWTVVADEPLEGPLSPLTVPSGYARGDCDEQGLS